MSTAIDGDLIIAEPTTLDGDVAGSLTIERGPVEVTSRVAGSVIVTGGKITLRGTVHGDVVNTGGVVIIEGIVDGRVEGDPRYTRIGPAAIVRNGAIPGLAPNQPSALVEPSAPAEPQPQPQDPIGPDWLPKAVIFGFILLGVVGSGIALLDRSASEVDSAQPIPTVTAVEVPAELLGVPIGTPASSEAGSSEAGASGGAEPRPDATTVDTQTPTTTAAPALTEAQYLQIVQATERLAGLERLESYNALGYDDADFSGWFDEDGDCQSTRHEMLLIDSLTAATIGADGCKVVDGTWVDPWSGTRIDDPTVAVIVPTVPFEHAYGSGGADWSLARRRLFANDLASLSVQTGELANERGSRGPASWQSPAEVGCQYAIDWIDVKARWGLGVIDAEAAALSDLLATCA